MSSNGTILVTGGAGYIGSHTCKALAKAGFRPVAYDNLVHGHRWAVKWGPLVVADIQDAAALARAFRRFRPQAVVHFAAYAYVGESVEQPLKYYHNNVAGSLQLLDAMQRHGVDKVVFSSTCATYGVPTTERIVETHAQNPINPYGSSKLTIERVLQDCSRAGALRHVSLRYFNAAGADPDGEIGEDHDPETHLIPRVLGTAAGKLKQIDVFGTDYPTSDGTAVRDYIHVSDLAEAHVQALQYLLAGKESVSLNLGVGSGYSVREVIDAARRVTGKPVAVREQPRRAGDPATLVADAALAQRVLGWRPRFTQLDDILATAWRWSTCVRAAAAKPRSVGRAKKVKKALSRRRTARRK